MQAQFINTRMTSFWMYVSVFWGAVIKKIICMILLRYEIFNHTAKYNSLIIIIIVLTMSIHKEIEYKTNISRIACKFHSI